MNAIARKQLKTGFVTLIAGLLVGLIAACGSNSSKNLGDYSKLKKKMGPPHSRTSPVQTYLPNLFQLELTSESTLNFVVGQRNVARFYTTLNLKGTRYRLVSNDLPRGSEPLKDLGGGYWELAWTPSPDLIPAGLNSRPGGFHLSLSVIEVTDLQSKSILPMLNLERTFNYTLLRPNTGPEIVEIRGKKVVPYPQITKISEGDILDLEIIVKDPLASPGQKPELIPLVLPNRISAEQSKISGHGFLFLDSEAKPVEPSQPGVWKFNAIFDTKNNSVPEFNIDGRASLAPSLYVDLGLRVLSPNRTLSAVKTISFEITYRRELLKPAFKANPELSIVTKNSTWTYSFESYLPSPVGTMTTFLSEETIKLPGSPKMRCKLLNRSTQLNSCQIDWKVPCSIAAGDLIIKVIAASEYQGQNLSTEFQKKLTISENAKCVPPKPKETKPKAKSVPSETQVPTPVGGSEPTPVPATPSAEASPTPFPTPSPTPSQPSLFKSSGNGTLKVNPKTKRGKGTKEKTTQGGKA